MDKIEKSPEEWRQSLTPEQFHVTREGGTERAFTGALWDEKRAGRYDCACCGARLFESGTKYESGTGWPSFWQPIEGAPVELLSDHSHGMVRTEVQCGRCNAHLGHLFDDGPAPTGQRYCMNSVALQFTPEA